MKNQTELMRSILTSKKAQEIIDYVSPIYGDSYVGLWLFQAIGTALDELCTIAEQLRHETSLDTADLLMEYWCEMYGRTYTELLGPDFARAMIYLSNMGFLFGGSPASPYGIEYAVSNALGGVEVEVVENVAKNTFLVNIRDSVDSILPAIAVLERLKPAHLIYQIQMASQIVSDADIKVAIAVTHAEQFRVEVHQ